MSKDMPKDPKHEEKAPQQHPGKDTPKDKCHKFNPAPGEHHGRYPDPGEEMPPYPNPGEECGAAWWSKPKE